MDDELHPNENVVPPYRSYTLPRAKPKTQQPSYYNFDSSKHQQLALAVAFDIKWMIEAASQLKHTTDILLSSDSPLLHRSMISSNPSAATATASHGASMRVVYLEVFSIAEGQTNTGHAMAKNNRTSLADGEHSFKITVGEYSQFLSIQVQSRDTNEQVLNKIRRAIRLAGVSITTSLAEGADPEIIHLSLTSKKTGSDQAFSIIDTSGHVIADTGIARMVSFAKGSLYSLDGNEFQTSPNNTFKIDDDITVTLLQATSDKVILQMVPDLSSLVKYIYHLANDYNTLLHSTWKASWIINQKVTAALEITVEEEQLERLGLQKQHDGTFHFMEDFFRERPVSEFVTLHAAITHPRSIVQELNNLAERLATMPASTMVDESKGDLMRYNLYHHSMKTYSFLPHRGILLNDIY